MANKNAHIDEITLELYVLQSSEVERKRSEIESHLNRCAGCRETYDSISSFYTDVRQDLENVRNLPVPVEETLPAPNIRALERRYRDHPIRRQVELMIPLRVARWIFQHPYVSAGGGLATVALAVALIITTFTPPMRERRMNS